MFQKLIDHLFKLMEFLVVVLLLAMVVMVFGNVVMRYGFNSGILISEEMARYSFVWLTYIGAILAMREGGHLGVDTLLKKLPLDGKKFCVALSEALMLGINVMFFIGTLRMHQIQATSFSPVAGISMIWVYGVGYITAAAMSMFNAHKLWLLATGRLREDQMIHVAESEESVIQHQIAPVQEKAPT